MVLGLGLAQGLLADEEEGRLILEQRQHLEEVQRTLKAEKDRLARLKAQERNQLNQIFSIQRQIHVSRRTLDYSKQKLNENTKKMRHLQRELNYLETQYDREKRFIFSRIRDIHQQNNLGYVAVFFVSRTQNDFLNNQYYLQRLVKKDSQMLDSLAATHQQMKSRQEQIFREKNNIKQLIGVVSEKKRYFQVQEVFHQKLYSNVKKEREEYELRVAELEKQSGEIESYIRNRMMGEGRQLKKYGSGTFAWPARGRITSTYGMRRHPIFRTVKMHNGVDIAASYGSQILAADSGEVVFAGWWGTRTTGYGQTVIIAHGAGLSTVYAHQSRILVSEGQEVEKGQAIGLVGSTGYSTGPHLHVEVRRNGKTEDPMRYLPQR
jgi:murein DD-endopeptidase MepM/ murein hydrolase activator NlpD